MCVHSSFVAGVASGIAMIVAILFLQESNPIVLQRRAAKNGEKSVDAEKKEEKKGYVEVTEYSADAYAQATDALEDEELNDVVDIEKYEKQPAAAEEDAKQPVDEETERKGVENANKLNAILDSIEKKKGES